LYLLVSFPWLTMPKLMELMTLNHSAERACVKH